MENEKLLDLMEKMYGELQGIKKEVSFNTEKIDSVAKVVARIENDHGNKLEALFDGYKQNYEKLSRIETEVSKHEEVILRRIK
ncbi:MAG TPA: hypothetical protein VIK72_02145 [Clostridiaceae bacterium]